ncbi:monocarboxylate uptake permease MctP [Actinopolymorpha pittospori]|uniref:SSS family solute:Na+ symporter n=1 Tax=Actinopolymorpha pittospori TaxID=648752 RepID=A0A927N7H5_9ACTN|nr:sodium:solute symporter [Actinopolymorpha pittospori]MBE1611653.1 SSS family solute:Na+ symporter [Actinopolymorpha pittospori]
MKDDVDTIALVVVLVLFAAVTVLGFKAARWSRGSSLASLDEWGLGGRRFGTWVTWFLLGGDLYTAYTFIAVPAVLFASGAQGFFAVPYTIIVYPLVFLFLPRLWSVSHRRGYVTPADFVRGRFGSRALALAIALTGILATMPYIALQLVGIQAVFEVMGLGGSSNILVADAPLFLAFAILAAYTYSSGLRAPALIAFVKDALIYLVIAVAIIYIPTKLGGWTGIFDAAEKKLTALDGAAGNPADFSFAGVGQAWPYATLALGSAMALFMYPHAITAVLSSKNRSVPRRNAAILPAYSFLLALLALLGFMAIAVGVNPVGLNGKPNAQLSIPLLFETMFPSWFAGVAFAAVAIGALVPAAIMSIAAANLWSRNVYKAFLRPGASHADEAKQSKVVSLLVKFGALLFVLGLDKSYAINLQLLGGIWILQTFPAIVFGLYTRWFHRWALFAGWAVGMIYGTWTAYNIPNPASGAQHFGGSTAAIPLLGEKGYVAFTAWVLNVVVTVVLTLVFRAFKVAEGHDETSPDDYHADAGEPGVRDVATPGAAGKAGAAAEA